MNTFHAFDGTKIFFKDWGKGRPVVFSHGWPLSSDAWETQMLFLAQNGYRVVAHDRRGHGRSAQVWENHTMDQYADDLAALMDFLELDDATLVGHSTGGGEIVRYVGRHGTGRVSALVLAGAVTQPLLRTEKNPAGAPLASFDEIRRGVAENRAQYFRDFSVPFFGYNRADAKISEGIRESFWHQGMMGAANAHYDCVRQFSESDFTEDLKKIDVPTLLIHGDDDQIVPIELTSKRTAKLIPKAELKIYKGAPHGIPQTRPAEFNADLLAFLRSSDAQIRESA